MAGDQPGCWLRRWTPGGSARPLGARGG